MDSGAVVGIRTTTMMICSCSVHCDFSQRELLPLRCNCVCGTRQAGVEEFPLFGFFETPVQEIASFFARHVVQLEGVESKKQPGHRL